MKRELNVYNIEGEVVGKLSLPEDIFNAKINRSLLWEVVQSYLKNQRKFTASTKTRAQVRGGGRKPWRQKGTGRARQGSIRAPQWRGGGVVFGPSPRNVYIRIPQKKKIKALQSSLNARIGENNLLVLDKLEIHSARTRDFIEILKNLKIEKRVLFVDEDFVDEVKRAVRNIPYVDLLPQSLLNAYEVLRHNKIVVTKDALKALEERIKRVLDVKRR